MSWTRRIGPIGMVTRLLAAAGLLYLAFFDGASWGLEWYDAAVGLGLLPAASIAFGLGARRYASGLVRFTGSAGTTANCLLLVGLAVHPYTAGGAALFDGATLVVAAWRALPGCEGTVLPNTPPVRVDASSPVGLRVRRTWHLKGPHRGWSAYL